MVFKIVQKITIYLYWFYNITGLNNINFFRKIFVEAYLLYKNIFEYEEIKFALQYLTEEHNLVLDCGANIGWFSLEIASQKKYLKVISVEPNEMNYNILTKRIERFGIKNVTPFKLAVSNSNTKLNLKMDPKSHANSTISLAPTGITVDSRTVDDFAKEFGRIDLIKIDTQGHEVEILNGASKTLEFFHPALLIEIDNSNPERTEEISAILSKYQYKFYRRYPQLELNSIDLKNSNGYFIVYCL
jgi:FkbM family methyltransferase